MLIFLSASTGAGVISAYLIALANRLAQASVTCGGVFFGNLFTLLTYVDEKDISCSIVTDCADHLLKHISADAFIFLSGIDLSVT